MRSQERLCVVGPLVRAGCTHVYASRGGSAHRPGSCHARPRHAYPGLATRAGDRPRSSMASLRIARAVTHRRRVWCIGVAAASQASSQTACARQASACRRDGMPTRCQMLQPGVRTCTDPKRCRRIGVAEAPHAYAAADRQCDGHALTARAVHGVTFAFLQTSCTRTARNKDAVRRYPTEPGNTICRRTDTTTRPRHTLRDEMNGIGNGVRWCSSFSVHSGENEMRMSEARRYGS